MKQVVFVAVALTALIGATPSGAQAAAPPLAHAEFIRACISGGGMSGFLTSGGGSADLLQIGSIRPVELSVMSEKAGAANVLWRPVTAQPMKTTTLSGASSMFFNSDFVKLMSAGPQEVSWCVRIR